MCRLQKDVLNGLKKRRDLRADYFIKLLTECRVRSTQNSINGIVFGHLVGI